MSNNIRRQMQLEFDHPRDRAATTPRPKRELTPEEIRAGDKVRAALTKALEARKARKI